MNTRNLGEIKAVAFDIDGTLYENWKLNIRLPVHFLSHLIFFMKYNQARKDLRRMGITENFEQHQAEYMAKALNVSEDEARRKMDKIVYTGIKHHFIKIKPCKNAVETVFALKEAGYKIALLSDFPPEQKGELWGIKPLCDVILGTETCGALKPSPVPFEKLAEKLEVKPEEILYVGNSFKYDVRGSKNAGMKAAWFSGKKDKTGTADFIFKKYDKLKKLLLDVEPEKGLN